MTHWRELDPLRHAHPRLQTDARRRVPWVLVVLVVALVVWGAA